MSVDSRPRNLLELSDRWRPYRSLAVSYLFASEYDE
jgi:3-methyladenine DNA glycosylase/8-oxoguanine DNA glycosylase